MELMKDFPVLKNNKNLIYFDNAATVLKPKSVIDAEINYLTENGANSHSSDFTNAILANELVTETRSKLVQFLNANDTQEIVFTSGTTHSLNQVAFGLKHLLKSNDEILLTALEHASNLFPWLIVAEEINAQIKMLNLKDNGQIDLNKMSKMISKKTKILAFAHGSNTVGTLNDVAEISALARKINPEIIIVIDAAQTVGHTVIDLKKWNVDFVAFSAHKMYGPFGIGVLWGQKNQLEKLIPLMYGGGMSYSVEQSLTSYQLNPLPERLEAGTINLSGVVGLNAALDYLNQIGLENIQIHETQLKKYAVNQIKKLGLTKTIDFYNLNNDSPLLTFNAKKWNAQDIANFLDHKYKIAVRSGAHCARLTKTVYGSESSVRASFAVYNTKKEIDIFLQALQKVDNFLDIIF